MVSGPRHKTELLEEHAHMLATLGSAPHSASFTIEMGFKELAGALGPTCPSTVRSLGNLELLDGHDLELESIHYGCWLLCRVISDPIKMVSIASIVETPDNCAFRLSVYDWDKLSPIPERALPKGAIMGIKFPLYKTSLDGKTGLRCDDPKHLVFIDPRDEFLRQVAPEWYRNN
jgi:hypothetical protein